MQKQKGLTFVSFLANMVLLVMVVIVVIRIIPVYYQYYSIMSTVKSLNSTPVSSMTGEQMSDMAVLRDSFSKRLEINGLDDLKTDQLTFTPSGMNKFTVRVKYQVIKPLVYNVSLLFDFDSTREVIVGSER
ncbi:DUF4845 domain-containing protein [Legionella waltersii]|uniref:Transmembrane protein n=1 Tax=Legionella waltersii TaxID=66969 RepID=A0A0W1A211_9GAMM|nr:DUF4845 domain-containing protein [Legionella waltersii]KTD75273.1 transmembrane protein [Legionella waltersii]SNV06850.1 transmembrane protein [Legionella waltersii]